LRRTADLVVVGGGIIGSSIALQLAVHDAGSIVLVDKGAGPGEGSTGSSSSITRCRYTYPEVIRLAHHGQRAFANWQEFTGIASPRAGLVTTGILWMMAESLSKTTGDVGRLRAEGVTAEVLDATEVLARFPMLATCGEVVDFSGEVDHVCVPGESFLYEPTAGYVDPVAANQDLLEGARALGVATEFSSEVVGLEARNGRVEGVVLGHGDVISAGLVMNAAGPWCNALNAMAGWDHRWTLTPTRIQTVYRDWPEDLGRIPGGADSSTGIYFRPDSAWRRIMVGSVREEDEMEVVDDPDHFKRSPDAAFTERALASLHHRVPGLEPRGGVSGIAGLYTINREDVHPIVGPSGVDGFWVANGFSGHGFKLAPSIGSLVAQAVTGRTVADDTDVPIDFFSADREPIALDVKHVLA
jgi:glycine/D-amino acid oxidase-like deaminating enzyme